MLMYGLVQFFESGERAVSSIKIDIFGLFDKIYCAALVRLQVDVGTNELKVQNTNLISIFEELEVYLNCLISKGKDEFTHTILSNLY